MSYKYITVNTDVEVCVDMDEFDDEDLVEEMKSRGIEVLDEDSIQLVTNIYEKRRLGQDYQKILEDLIYRVTGKFI